MNWMTVLLLATIVLVYALVRRHIHGLVRRIGLERKVNQNRVDYVVSVMTLAWTTLAVIVAGMVIGLNYQDVGLFFGSAIAVLGVALFAQWSILSNVTASVIVFFFFPYRVGDYIRILDGDNGIEGVVREITLFHVILDGPGREIATYPNALVFQKAVTILPAPPGQEAPPPAATTPQITDVKA
jgi:small-conductance mechanosensitive channel